MKEGCKNAVWLSQYQLPNSPLPATNWNTASPPAHGLQDHLGQQNTSMTLKHDRSPVREIIINTGKQTQLLSQMLAINTTGSLAFRTTANQECQGSIIYARKRKLSDPTMPTDRAGVDGLFTEPFQRRMPLINQHLTVMLKRKEKFCWPGKIISGLNQVYFYNSIFERIGGREIGRDTETVFVNFAATPESWWIVEWLPTVVARLHTVFSVSFLYAESWTAIRWISILCKPSSQGTNEYSFTPLFTQEYVCVGECVVCGTFTVNLELL